MLSRESLLSQIVDKRKDDTLATQLVNPNSNLDIFIAIDSDILTHKKDNILNSDKIIEYIKDYRNKCIRCGKYTAIDIMTTKRYNNDLCEECEKEVYNEYQGVFFTQPREIEFKW